MQPQGAGLCVSTLIAVFAGAVPGNYAAAGDEMVTLSISGSKGARVRGRCILIMEGGDQTLDLDERVPFERRWVAKGLRCKLEADGLVTVEAISSGSSSRASTSGGQVVVYLR